MRLPRAEPIYLLAGQFRQRCLVEGRCFLWPAHGEGWTLDNLNTTWDAFVGRPDTSGRTFLEKFRDQLADQPQDIHRIAADLMAFYWLVPTSVRLQKKLQTVREVVLWKLPDEQPDLSFLEEAYVTGVVNPGAHYLIAGNWQLSFYLEFARAAIGGQADLMDPTTCQRIADDITRRTQHGRPARHMLLHMFFPEHFQPIASEDHKRKILRAFQDLSGGARDPDDALLNIERALEQRLGIKIDWYSDERVRSTWDKKRKPSGGAPVGTTPGTVQPAGEPRVWVEKTIVQGRPDREGGEFAVGRALWSPQQDKAGKDIYRFMREVQPGDIVLHLTDNEAFTGVSRASATAEDFDGLAGTEWGEGPSYLVRLRDFAPLSPPLSRGVFFASPFRERLIELLESGVRNLFYNREPALNQGAYLTPAPPELLAILNDAYKASAGGATLTDMISDIVVRPPTAPQRGTWIFQANPRYYDARGSLGVLREQQWAVAEFRSEIHPGDKVFLWESGRQGGIIAVAEILDLPVVRPMPENESAFVRDSGRFQREEARVTLRVSRIVDPPLSRERILADPALVNLGVLKRPQGTNYRVTDSEDRALELLLGSPTNPPYDLSQCAEETGIDQETLGRWVRAIERKGQAIIYGPPGTGKTYLAERIARHLIAENDGFAEIAQFHPAYTYEDFVQGIRPKVRPGGGLDYPLVPGRFLEFCDRARSRSGHCVLILDEINRANLARVFGELMYLLEYRERTVPLAAGGTLEIPRNVRLIGTMNTADRSIALVDHALRRRFAFLQLEPKYDVLERYHTRTGFAVDGLVGVLRRLNAEIGDPNYAVGISFFLRSDIGALIGDVWQMEIEPYLEEFFFDQRDKVSRFRWDQVRDRIVT